MTVQDENQPSGPTLSRRAVGGVAWLMADSLGAKLIILLTQIILAQFIDAEHFGLFALVLTVMVFVEFAARSGIRDILIRRHRSFAELAPTGMWMSVGLGLGSALLIVVLAPVAARVYNEPALTELLYWTAMAPVLMAIGVVPRTQLEIQMRFRALTIVSWIASVTRLVVSVGLALMGFGAEAIVFGLLGYMFVSAMLMLALASSGFRLSFSLGSARSMLGGMWMLYLAGLMSALIAQGDYFLLGLFVDSSEVGVYYIAFALGIQVVTMFGLNLGRVLQPALAHLIEDEGRLRAAFVRSAKLLMLVGAPVCFMQAALAEALVLCFLRPEYLGAVLPLVFLSIGMAFKLLNFAAVPMIKAQGRFRTYLFWQTVSALQLLLLAGAGAWLAGAWGCALGVGLGSAFMGIALLLSAMRGGSSVVSGAIGVFAPPVLCSILAGTAAYLPGLFLPETRLGAIAHILVGGSAGTVVYAALVRVFLLDQAEEFLRRTEHLWRRLPGTTRVIRLYCPGYKPGAA